MSDTPALDAMHRAVEEGSQAIGEFLEWLPTRGLMLAEASKHGDLYPAHVTIERLLAEYFDIDLEAVDRERKAILAALRDGAS